MTKSMRTMIFVPGYKKEYLDKARAFDADALVLDLEDSVPDAFKARARANIRDYLGEQAFSQTVYVRVNPIDSGLLFDDLDSVLQPNTTGVMLPKVADGEDVRYVDRLLSQYESELGLVHGHFSLCPLVESGIAIIRAYDIAAASKRVRVVAFGGEDYLTDLDGLHKEHGRSLIVPRSLLVIAARAARVDVVDTPYLNIRDMEGFRREAELARELGFSGMLIVHPAQLPVANAVFSPSGAEVAEAEAIIAAIEQSRARGLQVTLLDGDLVGPPMLKRARNVIEKVRRIGAAGDVGGD